MWKGDTAILAFCKILQVWRLQERQSQKMEETSWQICYSFPNSAQQTVILFYCRIFCAIELNLYTMYIQQRGSILVWTPAWSSRCLVPLQSNSDLTSVLMSFQAFCPVNPSASQSSWRLVLSTSQSLWTFYLSCLVPQTFWSVGLF
jgi:hypothetical protein